MVYQKFAKEELFRKMQKANYMRYVCLPLPSLEQIRHGDLIVFQEVDRGRSLWVLFFSHAIVDAMKARYHKISYWLDQTIHYAVLAAYLLWRWAYGST